MGFWLYIIHLVLHDHCFRFLLGHEDVPREIENNAYAVLFGGGGGGRGRGGKQGVLWDLRK